MGHAAVLVHLYGRDVCIVTVLSGSHPTGWQVGRQNLVCEGECAHIERDTIRILECNISYIQIRSRQVTIHLSGDIEVTCEGSVLTYDIPGNDITGRRQNVRSDNHIGRRAALTTTRVAQYGQHPGLSVRDVVTHLLLFLH